MSQPTLNIHAMDKGGSLYKDVLPLSVETQEQVIPDGEVWEVQLFYGNAAYLDDVVVYLCWDYGGAGEEILVATHGDLEFQIVRGLIGDGVKKLAIVLDNATTDARMIGASWHGVTK